MIAPRCALLGALITAAACAPLGAPGPGFLVPPPRSLAAPSACDLPGDSTAAPDTLTVAASGAIDPAHAPSPVTPAERVLFRQLYETLLRSDCEGDRKSTRLNSSHVRISYAVFCLKKKKKNQ